MDRDKGKEAVSNIDYRTEWYLSQNFPNIPAAGVPNPLDVGGGGWLADEDLAYEPYEQRRKRLSVSHRVNQAKGRPDLFPPKALQLAGQVLAFGEAKHPDEKWKGMTSGEHIGACWRHMLEHQAGNTYDSESGELHLAHAFVRLGMALDQYLGFR